MEYSFSSIEEQEAHFELTHDTFLRKDRAKYIAQQSLSGSEQSSSPKLCDSCYNRKLNACSTCKHHDPANMNEQCIVWGCTNKKHQGEFVGDICKPCYEMITTGKAQQPSTNFIHELYISNQRLDEVIYPLKA